MAGNVEQSTEYNIVVDRTAPSVNVTAGFTVGSNVKSPVKLSFDGDDGGLVGSNVSAWQVLVKVRVGLDTRNALYDTATKTAPSCFSHSHIPSRITPASLPLIVYRLTYLHAVPLWQPADKATYRSIVDGSWNTDSVSVSDPNTRVESVSTTTYSAAPVATSVQMGNWQNVTNPASLKLGKGDYMLQVSTAYHGDSRWLRSHFSQFFVTC